MNFHGSTLINSKSLCDSPLRATINFLFSLVASLAFLLPAGCTNTTKVAVTVDRHSPESVLHAYFDAWDRSDWAGLNSFMDEKYGQIAPEPVDSIRIIEMQSIANSSSTDRTYYVVFDIKVKGQGVSMHSGRYDWSYYLIWEPKRGSWIITNYGAG